MLRKNEIDCMVLDLGLKDISGFDLIEKIKSDEAHKDLPVIIYTGKELSKKEQQKLNKYAESIIIKGAKSPERLKDEVSLFLHSVESDLPAEGILKTFTGPGNDGIFKGKKILLVDDDVRNIFALSSVLGEKEMEVEVAENGREALEKIEQSDGLDLILMDIMMPEMDGYETMRRIRKNPEYQKMPIIALTAKAMKGDRQKCIEAGASDYLSKPIDIEKLLSLMQVWLYK
jgi:CheY-like chemotaxis protein